MGKKLAVLAIGAALAAAFGIGTMVPAPPADAAGTGVPIRFAYVGDSITADPPSWLHQMDDPTLVPAGGFAQSGTTSGQMLQAIAPVPHDVLVIMAGTNDVRLGITPATVVANFDQLVKKMGSTRVVIALIPPNDILNSNGINQRERGYNLNRALVNHAAKRGWLVGDPFSSFRRVTNGWVAGYTRDRMHPVPAASKAAADRMEVYIRQAFEGAF